jgi:hypothetical protein
LPGRLAEDGRGRPELNRQCSPGDRITTSPNRPIDRRLIREMPGYRRVAPFPPKTCRELRDRSTVRDSILRRSLSGNRFPLPGDMF